MDDNVIILIINNINFIGIFVQHYDYKRVVLIFKTINYYIKNNKIIVRD